MRSSGPRRGVCKIGLGFCLVRLERTQTFGQRRIVVAVLDRVQILATLRSISVRERSTKRLTGRSDIEPYTGKSMRHLISALHHLGERATFADGNRARFP